MQLDLFLVQNIYEEASVPLSNQDLYRRVCDKAGLSAEKRNETSTFGKGTKATQRNKVEHRIRWFQQQLKSMGIIQRVRGKRGIWELGEQNKKSLVEAGNVRLLAFSTKLGVSVWGDCASTLRSLGEPIHLYFSSPPYPLRVQRDYGNVAEQEYISFVLRFIEPVVYNLCQGGSIVLNLSNDIFNVGKPSRSTYIEQLVLAMTRTFGLELMDRNPWVNPSKPPSPTYWACRQQVQQCASYEHILWFTNDAANIRCWNRNVLTPHSDNHLKLIAQGGEHRNTNYANGAYRIKPGDFANQTAGKLPRNVLIRGHSCADTREARRLATSLGLPAHPAMMPTSIPEHYIKLLTKEGDLVVDGMSGSGKTLLAAQRNQRRWLGCEYIAQYIRTQAELFRQYSGFWINPAMVR